MRRLKVDAIPRPNRLVLVAASHPRSSRTCSTVTRTTNGCRFGFPKTQNDLIGLFPIERFPNRTGAVGTG